MVQHVLIIGGSFPHDMSVKHEETVVHLYLNWFVGIPLQVMTERLFPTTIVGSPFQPMKTPDSIKKSLPMEVS